MAKKKISKNYLDLIPRHNEKYPFEIDGEGNVTLFVEHRGIFHKAAQLLLDKPKVTQVHLEGMGNFIWAKLDGRRTVYDVALLVKEEFGEEAEPLYERLVRYVKTLEDYGFVVTK